MEPNHKTKLQRDSDRVKAGLIRKHGTIAAYIRQTGRKPGTVYAAIKFRRSGPESVAIRKEALA